MLVCIRTYLFSILGYNKRVEKRKCKEIIGKSKSSREYQRCGYCDKNNLFLKVEKAFSNGETTA